jgi:choline dehydrogenase-like flavoprotein
MIVDLSELENGSALDADLCIVGGGAAGIAIAQSFLGKGKRVCLLESGGYKIDEKTQRLNDATPIGEPDKPPMKTRFRALGGSMFEWGGACAPLDALDFKARPWVADSGWPFSLDALTPHYAAAQSLLEIGPFDYAPKHWETERVRFLGFDEARAESRIWQFSPRTNFGLRYRDVLGAADEMRVLLNATATEVKTDPSGARVEGIAASSLDGRRITVQARDYVIACGGIENARLLLLSNQQNPAGVGNAHGLVGRYFMQHPHVFCASVAFNGKRDWLRSYKDFKNGDIWLRARIGLSGPAQQRLQTLNGVVTVVDRFITDDVAEVQSLGFVTLMGVLGQLRKGHVPAGLTHEVKRMLSDVPGLVRGLWGFFSASNGRMRVMAEQLPNPDSRITLGNAVDAFGQPLPIIDWRLTDRDRQSILTLVNTVGQEFERLGIGRVTPDTWLQDNAAPWPDSMHGGYHHMGATRMAADPRHGVVDADARVHGVDNLFVAGSSIFPTVGCANPTLTIVATSLRLAEHLQNRLAA